MTWWILFYIIYPCAGAALTLLGIYLEKRPPEASIYYDIFGIGLPILLLSQTLILSEVVPLLFEISVFEIAHLVAAIISFITMIFIYLVRRTESN